MKKMFIVVILVVVSCVVVAQERRRLGIERRDSLRTPSFVLPDSLAHMSPWKTDYRTKAPIKTKPSVSMSSMVVIQKENLPANVTVINNNTLRLGRHFNISNGQAWNFSPFPDAYLDARTLSFPAPR